jgi:hypothetical protein
MVNTTNVGMCVEYLINDLREVLTLAQLSALLADYGVTEASRAQIVEGVADFEALVNPFAGGVHDYFEITDFDDRGRIRVIIMYPKISDYRYPVPLAADVLVNS